MPSQLNSNQIKLDLEFERLLYLASILQVRRGLQPTKVGEAQQLSSAPGIAHQAAKTTLTLE